METRQLTPSAKALYDRISGILSAAKLKKEDAFIDDALQSALMDMTTRDMLDLEPPSIDKGVWTNDSAFCIRLGSRIFGVSPESVEELPWQYYMLFTQITAANFLKSLGAATRS